MNVKLKRAMIITAAVIVKFAILTTAVFLLPRALADEDSETLYKIKDIVHSRVTPSARSFPQKMRMLGASGDVLFEDGQTTVCSAMETEEDFLDVIMEIPEITREVNELITQSSHLSYPATNIEIYIEHWSAWNIRIFPKQSRIALGINEQISFAEAVQYCREFENIDVGGYWGFEVDIPENVGELFADFDFLRSLEITDIMREDTETAVRELSGLEGVRVTLRDGKHNIIWFSPEISG